MIGGLAVAFGFMTRLPVGRPAGLDAETLSRAAVWFPLVGLAVGAWMGGVHALAALALDPVSATLIALLAAVLATGGFHEDGLADTADAAGAHVGRERRLEILHDSRVGTYGALALVFAVALPAALLSPLGDGRFLCAAVAGHVLGRWSSVLASWRLAPAVPSGSGALLAASAASTLAAGAMSAGLLAALVGPWEAVLLLAVTIACTSAGGAAACRLFGGATGDVFGAINKLVEVAAYATLAAVWA